MKTIYIDFVNIGDEEDFYAQLQEKIEVPSIIKTLDELRNILNEENFLPLSIEFVNMSVEQLETFEDLLTTLEDCEEEVEDFSFSYYLEQYED